MSEHKRWDWRKSSYSTGTGQECVEVAFSSHLGLSLRDSKNQSRDHLNFPSGEWSSFISLIKSSIM
ncbi:MAG: DUF397 domain-containing protein [Nocardiopsaceae bacterium]|nr:DUF397 domain-containing protein [Nocardiopsaceae bacterium]